MVDAATFPDDSLRVLRAVQFAARLEFDLDEATRALCRTIPLDDLPSERVWGEFEKLLLAPRPSIGFALAMELGVVAKLFPDCQRSPDACRSPSGIRRRRLGPHAAGHRSSAGRASTI
jgi:tRNA nucleotidyltransferase (CCA-adding enzyme)